MAAQTAGEFVPCIAASGAAAVAGRHKYRPPMEAFAECLTKQNKRLLARLKAALAAETASEAALARAAARDRAAVVAASAVAAAAAAAADRAPCAIETLAALHAAAPPTPEEAAAIAAETDAALAALATEAELGAAVERHARGDAAARAAMRAYAAAETITGEMEEATHAALASSAAAALDAVAPAATADTRAAVARATQSAALRNRGTARERDTVEHMRAAGHAVAVDARMLARYFSTAAAGVFETAAEAAAAGGTVYMVAGRTDGWIGGPERPVGVLEVKTRKSRFFEPDYDIDQLAAYVALSGADYGVLAQKCNGEFRVGDRMPREALLARWAEVKAGLDVAAARLAAMWAHPADPRVLDLARQIIQPAR